jgi:hypothetical protein
MSGRSNFGEMFGRELSETVILYHEAIARKIGISATEWKCLELLTRKRPVTAKHLAEASGLTTGAITGIVDRLEKVGYVSREDNPRRQAERGHPTCAKTGPCRDSDAHLRRPGTGDGGPGRRV